MTEKTDTTSVKNLPDADNAPKKKPAANRKRRNSKPWDVSQFKVEPQEGKARFHDFDLPAELMHAQHGQALCNRERPRVSSRAEPLACVR